MKLFKIRSRGQG